MEKVAAARRDYLPSLKRRTLATQRNHLQPASCNIYHIYHISYHIYHKSSNIYHISYRTCHIYLPSLKRHTLATLPSQVQPALL